jgi:arylsulfatase A-like enzyme
VRYTNFHSTSLCSPTRAALITGRNHHVAGFGVVGEIATGFPGYDSVIRKENGTLGEILKGNGYATSWFGKNHNTPFYQATQAGPFDQWPNGMGFEYFYGFMGGDASQWQPNLYRNTTAIYPFEGNPGWNLTTAMADEAIQYMKGLKAVAPEKPFLVYYVPGGTHSPHHPTPEWIKKISDMHLFDQGWNKVRETIFANQKRLGIMPPEAQLTPWPKELPQWDSLGFVEKKLFIKQADVFGAYLAYTDNEIGRVIQAVEDMGELDNTLIIYISRRQRREPRGHAQRHAERIHHVQWRRRCRSMPRCSGIRSGGPTRPSRTSRLLGVGDGHAVQVDQAGGVALRRHGPGRGDVLARPHHRRGRHPPPVPPCDRHRADHPRGCRHPVARHDQRHQAAADGRREHGLHLGQGNANAAPRRTTQYFEMLGNRAIYHDGWVAATTPATLPWELSTKPAPDVITGYQWELYHVAEDPTEFNDLAAKMPDKLKQMQDLFYAEAKKHDVLPLDNSSLTRWNAPRPT